MFVREVMLLVFCGLAFMAWGQNKHKVLLAERVYFGSGSAKIESKYEAALKQAAALQLEAKDRQIWIHAHTDSIGKVDYNEALSAQRARNTELELERLGADSTRMDIRHYGPYSPTSDNGTEQGRAENRRVAIYVIEPVDERKLGIWGVVRGQLRDGKTGAPLVGQLHISSLKGKDTVQTDSNGYYSFRAAEFNPTEFRAYAEGYFFVSKVVKPLFQDTLDLDFGMELAVVGGKMLLNDLYFRMGTAELMPASEASLDGIFTFLDMNKRIKIEISGHVNKPNAEPLDKHSESFRLSEDRAKAVYTYLLQRGIEADRLTYKGYGNWEMLYPNAETELEQQMNRRVELKVTN